MTTVDSERTSVEERLNILEEKSRRLKRGGIAVLVAFSAVILMGQARPSARNVEAEKFVLKDANGNVRGWIGVIGNGSELVLGNANEQPMITIEVSTDSDDLHFYGSRNSGMNLGVNAGDPSISIMDGGGNGGAGITFGKNGPSLSLEDGKGYSTIVGKTKIEGPGNEQPRYTSAASVVLFDKDKRIMWKAP